jgi:class 3 adenylate cyclase
MGPEVRDRIEAARDAIRRHAWQEARGLLVAADAEGGLDAEGLRQLGKVAEWCGDPPGALDAFERSYAAFIAARDNRGAARVALMLRHVCTNLLRDMAAARGWVQRAEHLLQDEPECLEHGYLWRAQGRRAYADGDPDTGRMLLEKAIALGRRLGDANLVAMSQSWLGVVLWEKGQRDHAFAELDEACAGAVGGELGPWATGMVYCNAISVYRDAGEFALGGDWAVTAQRWCQRESIAGFTGICCVYRAEFMRLRGALADAEQQARLASGELEGNIPAYAGEASYEIGMIRLRLGDLDGAEEAFRRAHELGREPQPGAALALAARGDPVSALRSLQAGSVDPADSVLDAMRCAGAEVELACDLGDKAAAERATLRSEELAAGQPGIGLRVLAAQARGTMQLFAGDPEAHKTLRRALKLWQEIDAPYEVAQMRLLLARALRQMGDAVGAAREVEAASAAFSRLGALSDATRARAQLLQAGVPAVATRTLFFSDIVGSTQLVEAIGDAAWHDLVVWLDGSLRQCFATHGGEEVDHAGDGFFVAFPDSKSALDCAVTIQRRLADHRREHGFAPRVRIGVHATTASAAAGRYRGRGVHEASRIAALAGPDEILASRSTVPPGFSVSQLRTVEVKGISKPVEVVRVEWART